MNRIHRDSGGLMQIAPGTLYPALKRLINSSLIAAVPGHHPTQYELTSAGLSALQGELRRLKNAVSVAEQRLSAQRYHIAEHFIGAQNLRQ